MSDTAQAQPRSAAERVSLAVALVVLALLVGAIGVVWVSSEGSEARFSISHDQVRAEGDQFYLPVQVTNDGDETASQVTVEGTLMVDGEEESVSTTVDFVPGHSQTDVVLIFSADPSDADVRVTSYQDP